MKLLSKVSFVAFAFAFGLLSFAVVVQAKETSVKSEDKLERVARRNELAVVVFYKEDRETRRDRELRRRMDTIRADFRALTRTLRYKSADLAFMSANITRNDLQAVAQELGLQEIPAVVL